MAFLLGAGKLPSAYGGPGRTWTAVQLVGYAFWKATFIIREPRPEG
jgi:hypothetical protein